MAWTPAGEHDLDAERAIVAASVDEDDPPDRSPAALVTSCAANLDHPRWDDVAERCLSCTNCTLVCPTCFCSAVEDVTSLER